MTELSIVKGILLIAILVYASISDILKHEVPDFVWIAILGISFIGFSLQNLPSQIIGAAAVFLPQFIFAMVCPSKALGGADIKISAALAFCLGAGKGIAALILGLTAAVLWIPIWRKIRRINKSQPFALVPFLSLGTLAAYLI